MPTLKAIRCSSLKSGRHDTKCLEGKKGLEKGEPTPTTTQRGGGEERVPQMRNLGEKRKLSNKKFIALHADSQQAYLIC